MVEEYGSGGRIAGGDASRGGATFTEEQPQNAAARNASVIRATAILNFMLMDTSLPALAGSNEQSAMFAGHRQLSYNGAMLSARRLKRLTEVAKQRQAGLVLVLEDIYDPHNAAAILRTCDGLGIQDVYVIFEQEKFYNIRKIGKVSSSSANKWLTFHVYRSSTKCFRDLKKKKYEICATVLNDQAEDASHARLTAKKIALVVGNEHRGISETAIKMANRLLYFPMRGFVESFNVSVSAALFLYEIVRQRAMSPHSTGYHPIEKEWRKLLADFKKR